MANPPKKGISPLALWILAPISKDIYIEPFVCIGAEAEIGDGAQIYSNAVVGIKAKVGKRTTLNANVTVYHHCEIGNDCILHSGCVIGADGFGFAPSPEDTKRSANRQSGH